LPAHGNHVLSSMGYNFSSVVWQLPTRCLILGVGFRGQAIQWRRSRDRGCKGHCHGNQFWDCITCKWTLTEDNDMRLSCKGWFVISHLWQWELLQTGDCLFGNWHVNCQRSTFFSVHRTFDVPGPIFAILCHTTRYAWNSSSPIGVFERAP